MRKAARLIYSQPVSESQDSSIIVLRKNHLWTCGKRFVGGLKGGVMPAGTRLDAVHHEIAISEVLVMTQVKVGK